MQLIFFSKAGKRIKNMVRKTSNDRRKKWSQQYHPDTTLQMVPSQLALPDANVLMLLSQCYQQRTTIRMLPSYHYHRGMTILRLPL